MKLNPYINFDDQCETAFKFYERVLNGRIEAMMRFGDTPAAEHVPAAIRNRIMHARLVVGDQVLMGSDSCPPDHPYEGVKGAQVALQVDSQAEAERIFRALEEGAKAVTMPLQETFWAVRFGMLVDRFNIPWMINCEQPA